MTRGPGGGLMSVAVKAAGPQSLAQGQCQATLVGLPTQPLSNR